MFSCVPATAVWIMLSSVPASPVSVVVSIASRCEADKADLGQAGCFSILEFKNQTCAFKLTHSLRGPSYAAEVQRA